LGKAITSPAGAAIIVGAGIVLWPSQTSADSELTAEEKAEYDKKQKEEKAKEGLETDKSKDQEKGVPGKDLPGTGKDWVKLKGNQGWRDKDGNTWNKDKLHKDHYDVTDRRGNKIREVDFNGNQIWPDGPKNKNK